MKCFFLQIPRTSTFPNISIKDGIIKEDVVKLMDEKGNPRQVCCMLASSNIWPLVFQLKSLLN